MADEFFGQKDLSTAESQFSVMQFIVSQFVNKLATVALVRITAVRTEGGFAPAGVVDVNPMVHQVTGEGVAVPHGIIYNVPYLRLQGGVNAVIIDPQVGDIGVCVFCMRDSSAVKESREPSPPGSARSYDWADGLYIGGWLNAEPEQYVLFAPDRIRIVSPTQIDLEAPQINLVGAVAQSEGDMTIADNLAVTGNVTAQEVTTAAGIGLGTHKHPTAGTGPPSPPIP